MIGIFFQLLINGLIAGSIYALIASGFSIIYSTNKFIHFAHGGVILISAYFYYWVSSILFINIFISAISTILFASFLGCLLNKFFYLPFRRKNTNSLTMLILSIALLMMFESIVLLIFDANVNTINFGNLRNSIEIKNVFVTPMQIVIILTALSLFISLYIFMKKTNIGKSMRAVADNKNAAEILGISSEMIYKWSFIIGSAIAGMASVLLSMEQSITPVMGTHFMIKGFTGAIVGGVGSVHGAIIGCILLGLIENFGVWFLPSGYKEVITFLILIVFLIFKPTGIMGNKFNNK